MNCWKCGKIMLCGCGTCKGKSEPPIAYVEKIRGDLVSCGNCGFTLNHNVWEDIEIENAEREQIGAFKGRPYDYDIYIELFERLKIPLAFSIKRQAPGQIRQFLYITTLLCIEIWKKYK